MHVRTQINTHVMGLLVLDLLEYHQGNELPAVAGKLPIPSSSRKIEKDPRIAHKLSQKKYRQSLNDNIDLLRRIVPESRKVAILITFPYTIHRYFVVAHKVRCAAEDH